MDKFNKPFHLSCLWLSFVLFQPEIKALFFKGNNSMFFVTPYLSTIKHNIWFTIVWKLQVFFWLLWHNDLLALTLQSCLSVELKSSGFAPSGRLHRNYANRYSAGYNLIMLYILNNDNFCKGKLSNILVANVFFHLFVFYKTNHIKKW